MTQPDRCCDLVMKGGITSGVVYPRAVEEIAKRFYLMGITGTSAGAIAAALAAAAEYRRRHSPGMDDLSGFERLAQLGDELGREGKLLELFTPDKETRKLFKKAVKTLDAGIQGWWNKAKLLRFAPTAFRFDKNLSRLTDNGYGLCSGMANGNRKGGTQPLTEWLHELIQEVSGKTDQEPLTFRDLHEAPIPASVRALLSEESPHRAVDYRAMSSCLSFSRPYELPFRDDLFAFDPRELAGLFPEEVVRSMIASAEVLRHELAEKGETSSRDRDGKLPVVSEEMPILVATRMSLSFPLLLSMVPLWAVDVRQDHKPLEKVWFSDGGITSNFPMHRFDALYPRWPTLGITLAYTGPSDVPRRPALVRDGGLIYTPKRRSDNRRPMWNHFDRSDKALGRLRGFGGAIFNTAQNWHDEIFLGLPQFQDRSVEIWMKSNEGGLNLEMPPEVVRALTARGREAGDRIARRFAEDSEDAMCWDGHRWTRFRTGLASLWDTLETLRHAAVIPPMAGRPPLDTWLSGTHPVTHEYRSQTQREIDRAALEDLFDLVAKHGARQPKPFREAPSPRLGLGTQPPY